MMHWPFIYTYCSPVISLLCSAIQQRCTASMSPFIGRRWAWLLHFHLLEPSLSSQFTKILIESLIGHMQHVFWGLEAILVDVFGFPFASWVCLHTLDGNRAQHETINHFFHPFLEMTLGALNSVHKLCTSGLYPDESIPSIVNHLLWVDFLILKC